nr:Uncharacterised protein [Salmonella sp. NCTC 7297]
MSVPVYQIMVKGCHIQEENLSFSPHLQKSFVDSSGSIAKQPVDNFVHKLLALL